MTAPDSRFRLPRTIARRGARCLAAAVLSTGACFTRAAIASAGDRPKPAAADTAVSTDHAAGEFPRGPIAPAYLDLLERYLELMQKFTRLAEDPAAAGVAGVFGSKDLLLSESDPSKAIEFFNGVLPEVKNEAVQRAIRIELIDLYKKSGQRDKALEQLRILVTSAPAEAHEGHEPHDTKEQTESRSARDHRPAADAPAPRQ